MDRKVQKKPVQKINPLTQLSKPLSSKLFMYNSTKKCISALLKNLAGQFYKLAEKSPNTYAKNSLLKKFL